jgi:hypothetical protein
VMERIPWAGQVFKDVEGGDDVGAAGGEWQRGVEIALMNFVVTGFFEPFSLRLPVEGDPMGLDVGADEAFQPSAAAAIIDDGERVGRGGGFFFDGLGGPPIAQQADRVGGSGEVGFELPVFRFPYDGRPQRIEGPVEEGKS